MAVTIKGNTSNVIYGKGDICLKLNPFDNYRLFTLYDDWRSEDRRPIDLSNNQKIYLVFKSKKKEIRIPEYTGIESEYSVDKVNGQVLFKISKKNAIDILSMDSNIFYITRVYEMTDYTGSSVVSSDEEVLYTGQWKDESSNTIDSYTSQIKNLMSMLEDRNRQIRELMESNVKLMNQNAELVNQLDAAQENVEKMSSTISDMEVELGKYKDGEEYVGEVINDVSKYTIIEGKNYTEEQMKEALNHLETIYQD